MIQEVASTRPTAKTDKRMKGLVWRGKVLHARFKIKINGETRHFLRSTETANISDAQRKRKKWKKDAQEQRFQSLEACKIRHDTATLGDVIDIYIRMAPLRDVSERTIKQNVLALKLIVRRGLGVEDVEKVPYTVLNQDLVDKYREPVLAAAGENQLFLDRARRTTRSTIGQARSVFSEEMMRSYEPLKLVGLDKFMTAFRGKNAPVKYHYPHQLAVPTLTAGMKLKDENPRLFCAYLLCYAVALRQGEAIDARKDWVRRVDVGGRQLYKVHVVTTAKHRLKADGSVRSVPISDEVYSMLTAVWEPEGEYILPGSISPIGKISWMRSWRHGCAGSAGITESMTRQGTS